MDTQKLEEKVKAMLDGEKKRREIALKWLDNVESILIDVAPHIWGTGDGGECVENAKYVEKIKDGKKNLTSIYFRYNIHQGDTQRENTGWYFDVTNGCQACWGKILPELKGKEFWWAIRAIIEWIPLIIEQIDEKSESREKLIQTINSPLIAP